MILKEITEKNKTILILRHTDEMPAMDTINVNTVLKTSFETTITDLRRAEQSLASQDLQLRSRVLQQLNVSRMAFHRKSATLIKLLKSICWEPDSDLESRIKHVQLLQKNVQLRWNKLKRLITQ